MKKQLIKALSLPDLLYVTAIEDDAEEIRVCCSMKKHGVRCLHCGGATRKFGGATNRKRHTFFGAKPVFLHITKGRFQCKTCKRVFAEQIVGMLEQRSTDHFNQLVQEKSRNQDYSSVGRELGISPATVMRKQDLLSMEKFAVPDEEEVNLGLDGKYLNGDHEIFVMGDVKRKKFFGVTKNNSTKNLKKTLLNWKPYILNHFDTGITNAYIEGLNNRIETLKRKRFGFRNTERFIKCIVFALLPLCLVIPHPLFLNYL